MVRQGNNAVIGTRSVDARKMARAGRKKSSTEAGRKAGLWIRLAMLYESIERLELIAHDQLHELGGWEDVND